MKNMCKQNKESMIFSCKQGEEQKKVLPKQHTDKEFKIHMFTSLVPILQISKGASSLPPTQPIRIVDRVINTRRVHNLIKE